MKRINSVYLVLFLLLPTAFSHARKHSLRSGLMPEVSISYTAIEKLKFTFEYSAQEVFTNKDYKEELRFDYVHYRTDLRGNIAYKLNDNLSFMSGYQFRLLHDKSIIHRGIFQVAYSQPELGKVIFKHRLRSDPTFYENAANKFRIRYRFGIQVPLNCKSKEKPKSYLFFADEPVYTYRGKANFFENRIFVAFGHKFNKQQKVQVGLEHRLGSLEIANNQFSHQLWLKAEWDISF